MRIGIVGLPNVGKSALFNLLTHAGARVEPYPFTTIDRNVGVVAVPDERLVALGRVLKPEKLTPATIELVDIAGLVEGASRGEGLGNRFLAHIREVDLIFHVLRGFDESVPSVFPGIDPRRDRDVVEAELALADLEVVSKLLARLVKGGVSDEDRHTRAVLEKVAAVLARGFAAVALAPAESARLAGLGLLCQKPVAYLLNVGADGPTGPLPEPAPFVFSARLEEEMAEMDPAECRALRTELGLAPDGPWGLVPQAFATLGLVRFYTVKGSETRAWSVPAGTGIVEAAGRIHSDLGAGFVKAEVTTCDALTRTGSFAHAREAGLVRVEGKEYLVKDGDVILIRFRT